MNVNCFAPNTADDARTTAGAVYVEFIISFMPVFVLFLAVVQFSLLAAAQLVVQHAAVMGVRSTVVVLEDEHETYGGEGFGVIDEDGSVPSGRGSRIEESLEQIIGWFRGEEATRVELSLSNRGGPRLRDIRRAVYFPLLAVSPPPGQIARWFGIDVTGAGSNRGTGSSLRAAIGEMPWLRFAAGLLYNKAAVAVTFPRSPDADQIVDGPIGPSDDVHLRVSYLFHCAVPLVSRLMCRTLLGHSGLGELDRALRDAARDAVTSGPRDAESFRDAVRRQLAERTHNLAVFSHVETPSLLWLLATTGSRFAVLTGQATLRNQGAGYYRNRQDDDEGHR